MSGARRARLTVAAWAAAAVAVATAAAVAGIGASYRKELQSDDLAQLVAIRSWREAGVSRYYAGSDTLLLRAPLMWLVDVLVAPSHAQLRLLVGVLCALAALAFVAAMRVQAQGVGVGVGLVGVVAALWLFTNPGVAEAIGRPLVRNVELGVAILGLVVLDRLVERRPSRPVLILGGMVVALSVLLWDDPYLTYLVVLPAAAVCLFSAATARSGWRALVAGALVVSVAGSHALAWLSGFAGIEVLAAPIRVLPGDDYDDARQAVLDQAPLAFAVSRRAEAGFAGVVAWGNRAALVVLLVTAAIAAVAVLRRWRSLPAGTAVGVLLVPLPLCGWVASSNVLYEYSWRYLVLTPFALAMLAPAALLALPLRARRAAVGVVGATLLVAAGGNLAVAVHRFGCGESCGPPEAADRMKTDEEFASTLRPAGVQKLFAPYWKANVTSYNTRGTVPAVAVACLENRVVARRWLVTEATYSLPTPVSHLLFDGGTVDGCAASAVEQQLGPPSRRDVVGGFELWSYGGDLSQRLPSVSM